MINSNIRIVVPCYNTDLTIEKCVASIFNSIGVDFELYLIDDGKNNILDKINNDYPVRIIKTSGQEGAGKARNTGTYGFKGQIVVFIDSDVQVLPDTIATLIKPIREALAEATVGSYLKKRTRNFCEAYKNFYLAYKYNYPDKYLTYTFWSAICAINYEVFEKMNGFKECFSGAGPEDIDLGVELSLNGSRILSVPQAQGIHLSSFNLIKLIKNDLRKGSEDIYIHWTRKVPIMYNRHVKKVDILGVSLACCMPVLLLFQYYFGFEPVLVCFLLYFIVRINFIKNAFSGEGFLFLIRSFILTYILDVIRGSAVIIGTLLFFLEILSSGKYKPFAKLTY